MSNQNVTVTIGAVLSGGFVSTFRRADRAVTDFRGSVRSLNTSMTTLQRTSTRLAGVMTGLLADLRRTSSSMRVLLRATDAATQANQRNVTANSALQRSLRSLTTARQAYNRAMAFVPPPIPRPPTIPPPHTPRGGGGGGTFAGSAALLGSSTAGVLAGKKVTTNAADWQASLLGVLLTDEKDPAMIGDVQKRLFNMSSVKNTAQGPESLVGGLNILVAAGNDLESSMVALRSAGRLATATQTEMEETAKTTNSLMTNFKVNSSDIESVFDVMATAGKEGSFELKDMARFFPSIGGNALAMGIKGKEGVASVAAALQVMRKNAGTAGQAATNMENLFSKMIARETIEKFDDVMGEVGALEARLKASTNPLEEIVRVTNELTGGDQFRIGELFRDIQARDAIVAMIQHEKEYQRIKEKSLSTSASGMMNRDYTVMAANAKNAMEAAKTGFFKLSITIGNVFLPMIQKVGPLVERMADRFATFAEGNPVLVSTILGVTAAGIGLMGVIGALGVIVPAVTAGWGVFMSILSAVGGAIAAVASVGLGPILAIGAAIAFVGALVYKFWEPLSAFFSGFLGGLASWFSESFGRIRETLRPVTDGIGKLWNGIKSLLTPLKLTSGTLDTIASVGRVVGQVIGAVLMAAFEGLAWVIRGVWEAGSWLFDIFSSIFNSSFVQGGIDLLVGGFKLVLGVVSGVVEGVKSLYNWVVSLFSKSAEQKAKITSYKASKEKMMQMGAWKSEFGDDALDTGRVIKGIREGKITSADLQAVKDGDAEVGMGDHLDQPYIDQIDGLIRMAATAEANRAQTQVITNSPQITVNAGPNSDPMAIAKAAGEQVQRVLADEARRRRETPGDSIN